VSVPDSPALRLGTEFTVDLWMNKEAETPDYQLLVGKGGGNTRNYMFFEEAGAGKRIIFQFQDAGGNFYGLVSNTGVEVGTWYRVTGMLSGGMLSLYVNGVLDASAPAGNAVPVTTADPFRIGYAGFHS